MTEPVVESRPITHHEPSNGTPGIIESASGIAQLLTSLQAGRGPIAVDAERASGFRYSQRAYLLQFYREGSEIGLLDPTTDASFTALATYVNAQPWILHAATQDLPCLREAGFIPSSVHDTELAAKLLGRPKVGLGALLEAELDVVLAKEHSAVDWSTRPIPPEWRAYAALDVEFLPDLHQRLVAELEHRDRLDWYEQERATLLTFTGPEPRPDAWRRTSGIHAIRDPRKQAIVRALWEARDARARDLDISAGRVLHDSVIIDIAKHAPVSQAQLTAMRPVHSRNARKDPEYWWAAIESALALPDVELPKRAQADGAIPPPKAWPQRNPDAAARWDVVRPAVVATAEALAIQPEVLISPETIRRLCWEGFSMQQSADAVERMLSVTAARPWQITALVAPITTALQAG
jgi:ribonuclease D